MKNLEIQQKKNILEQGLIPWRTALKRFNKQSRDFSKHIKQAEKEITELSKLLEPAPAPAPAPAPEPEPVEEK